MRLSFDRSERGGMGQPQELRSRGPEFEKPSCLFPAQSKSGRAPVPARGLQPFRGMYRTVTLTTLLSMSCAHTRPDEMTAEEHRSEAARHHQVAHQEESKYQPGLTTRHPGGALSTELPPDWMTPYNPTAEHLTAADAEMRRAASHLAAAKKLEEFEDAACREIPPASRAACPLLASSVSVVRNTPKGLVLVLKPHVDDTATHRQLNCHLAYAAANGFARPSCPLFVKGMALALKGNHEIEMTAENASVALELQIQARRIFLGEATPTHPKHP